MKGHTDPSGNHGLERDPAPPASDQGGPTDNPRRRFLARLGIGAVAGAAAAGLPSRIVAKSSSGESAKQYALVVDTRRCIGCHACSVACKSENDVPLGCFRSWVEYTEKGDFPNVDRSYLPRLCNHCAEPACVSVCPTGATTKREEDGIVVVDADTCIGCMYCMQACPYDARYIDPETGAADKCDFCLHRVSEGVVPSCVNTCQGKARIFGDLNDPSSEVSRVLARNATSVLQKGMGTEPNVFYIDGDHADPRDARYENRYIRVKTHRRNYARR